MPASLLVTNDLGPRAGGIETFIHGLIEEITSRPGNPIVIYTSHQEGAESFDAQMRERFGVEIIRDKSTMLLPTPRVNRAVAKIARERGITTFWFGALAPLGWMSSLLRRNGAERIIAITHGHEVWWSRVFPFSLLIRAMTRKMDAVTYLGDFTHGAMDRALSNKVARTRIAPGIDIDHFSPRGDQADLRASLSAEGKKIIICLGRLVPRKGQDKLIEALPQILRSHPDAILVIVGIGSYEAKLRALVESNGVSEQVRFVGRVAYEDLPRYLSVADLFAMPSRSRFFGLEVEGLGIVYLEASACGAPVLAGNSGGAPDAVLEGVTGSVVNGLDVDAIAKRVISLLDDPKKLSEMGQAGRLWAVNEWAWPMWGEKFRELLFPKSP